MIVVSDNNTLEVTFDSPVDYAGVYDTSRYRISTMEGVPILVETVELSYSEVTSGGDGGVLGTNRFGITTSASGQYTGYYLSVTSAWNRIELSRIVDDLGEGVLVIDRPLILGDPLDSSIPWAIYTGLEAVTLTTTKPTNGATYFLMIGDEAQEYTASVDLPQVVSAEQLDDHQVVITFSGPMRNDAALIGPGEYTFTGPSTVRVKSVQTINSTQVMLHTVGLEDGEYTLTVNASGTPHDVAGNPIDPVFNEAIFTGSPAITSRSIYVDKGPITKPEEVLQSGATATIDTATQVTLPGATVAPAHVGLYLRLTGTATNAGEFRITTRVSATVVRVKASFSLPDASNGSIGWELYDPRDGEIADDPSDVTVRINGSPAVPDAVVGLLGQIVLSAAPAPNDTVDVDYCWICNPVVDFRRLNSQEFRLNNWNRDNGRPVDNSQHKYRYNNTLIEPDTLVPLDLRAQIDQPFQRDLKYRAYERAYSVALNDPNLLLLNSPNHRISFPPLSRTIEPEFVNYEATVLPENAAAPWQRLGSGSASISSSELIVVDNTTGPFPGGDPLYWTRSIDLTYPHVFAIAWRMQVTSVTTYDGIFSGIAAGYADDKKAVVIGLLDDGGTLKIGVLRSKFGNDPSSLLAWIGGLDGSGDPTNSPADLDWSILRSYRIFRDQSGVVSVYIDGSITPTLQVYPEDLPNLEELNAPFDELQGAFFGSLSREAENESAWSFVRYTSIPTNPLQAKPSVFVSYEGDEPPEAASQPWTPVGFHGTDTILAGDFLLLDSTSAADVDAGLISGDFRGYSRIEPLLSKSYNTVLDVNVSLRTYTHGIDPNAVMAAIDDGTYLMQLCFFPEEGAPLFSYGGRALPEDFTPYTWSKAELVADEATASMVGQYLSIEDPTTTNGLVYTIDDASDPVGPSDDRVVGYLNDYMMEFRVRVLSYTADISDFCGVSAQAYDSLRLVGLLFQETAGTRYVAFHENGSVVGTPVEFDWFDDSNFHTYRLVKNTTGNLVSLFIDGEFVYSVNYSDFTPPGPSVLVGEMSFGSTATTDFSAVQSTSTAEWAYCNFWRVNSGVRKFAGLWKGYDSDSLTGYHLPLRTSGRNAAVAGNVLTDTNADFVADGVLTGDPLIVDYGPNKGVYYVSTVAPLGDVTKVTISGSFPVQPSAVDYRIVLETDWDTSHKYRIIKDPSGGVSVFIDSVSDPWIHADYNNLDLPSSLGQIPRTIAGGLPSVTWGAFDPANISQTYWDYVRLGAVRSQTELGIVPHHQVLNQRNIMASYEHHRTLIAHPHTNFWSESEGIPPQTDPDFLQNPLLEAYTKLNDGTPLVPSTQTYEVRSPQATLVSVSGLNRPEDVLNDQAFVLNESAQRVQIIVPDDVLYNCLKVIETVEGDARLVAPFDDECQPYSLGTLYFQNEVCLSYDGSVLPENDTTASTPWTLASDDGSHVSATSFAGVLTYGTDVVGTRTVYRNNTPLPDSISLQTEVKFRLRLLQDSTGGLGDSQVRVGFSSPGVTIGLAFVTTPLGERYVLAVDLNNGKTVGGIPFDFYDGAYHDYRLVRDPGSASIQIFIDN